MNLFRFAAAFIPICLCTGCWDIYLVQLGQTPDQVQSCLARRPSDISVKGPYRFVHYDRPGFGGEYVFIFKDGRLVQYGPESDLPDPDEMPDE